MSELPALLKAFEQSCQQDEATVLATVVKTQGSTYRRAGARLLMSRRWFLINCPSPHLQQQVGSFIAPLHLLLFNKSFPQQ